MKRGRRSAGDLPPAWRSVLETTELFGSLEPAALARLGAEIEELTLEPAEILVEQGAVAERVFVVLDGELEVVLEEADGAIPLGILGAGRVVGEIALLIGGRRSVTVRALTETRVLGLSRKGFEGLLESRPGLTDALSRQLLEQLRRVKLARYSRRLFGDLDAATAHDLEQRIEWRHLESGEPLFHQGDEARAAYIVGSGRLRVVVETADGKNREIAEVRRGEWIGEMALLVHGPRSASVYAVRDSDLARLSQDAFEKLNRDHPRATLELARLLVRRLQSQLAAPTAARPAASTFAVVPARPGLPVAELCRQLGDALAAHGSVRCLSSEQIDDLLDKPGIAQADDEHPARLRLAAWLMRQEHAFRFVVYQTDERWSPWTERAMRNADQVLIVDDAEADPAPGEVEARLRARPGFARALRASLVLLQPASDEDFTGTARWLDERQVAGHYHVRRGSAADVARLARLITGNGIGLVLGGGGARGFAHLGVLRALEELEIPIDVLGGTSMGALMAAPRAAGLRAAEILDLARRYVSSLFDPTLPLVSLLAGRRVAKALDQLLGTRRIEDLPVPFFCVSTNLTRAEKVIHHRGSLTRAVRASISLPGIFPPVPQDGELFVDGGLFDNLPIEVMAPICGGPVLAVDVSPEVELLASRELATELSGWQVLGRRLNPLAERLEVPGILSLLMRSFVVGSVRRQRRQQAEGRAALYLRLPVNEWRLLDFDAAEAIAERGYRASLGPLDTWWRSRRALDRRGRAGAG